MARAPSDIRTDITAPQDAKDGSPHKVDEDYIKIRFQTGPIGTVGKNGTQIEDVVEILLNRLRGFQHGQFRCRENALAITNLEQAQMWLERRTKLRQQQGVEGMDAPHLS